eukprot:gene29504-5851_t
MSSSLFVNSHKDLIGTKLTKSTNVYEAYILWKSKNKEIKRTLTHKRITTGLKELLVSKLNHEHHFVKEMVLSSPPESVINIQLIDLFVKFKDWLDVNVSSTSLRDRHNTTIIKFGQKMTKLVATTTNSAGFEGVLKKRTKDGVRYIIDVDIVRREMVSWSTGSPATTEAYDPAARLEGTVPASDGA